MRFCFSYDGKPQFLMWIRFVNRKDLNQALLHLWYRSTSLKMIFNVKRTRLINFLIPESSASTNSIKNPALPKIPSTRRSLRRRIVPEDECADFIANNKVCLHGVFNNITEKNCLVPST